MNHKILYKFASTWKETPDILELTIDYMSGK